MKSEVIESGISGIKICPKCNGYTCFVLPDFNMDTMEIIGYSCPKCKVKANNETK